MGSDVKIKQVKEDAIVFSDDTKLMTRDGKNLLDAYHEAVYDLLTKGTTDPNNVAAKYVKSSFKKLGESSLLTINRVVKDTAEYFAQDNTDAEFVEYRLSKRLFDWQKTVLASTAKKITMCCGRRTGKSYGEAFIAVNHCTSGYDEINGFRKPRKVALIGLTVEKAADIFWNNILNAAELSGMKYKKDNSKYKITFANGATIEIFGNNNKAEREKVRGTEFSLIIIDEAQSQNALHYLLTDIFGAIVTGRDSTVILSGTGSLTGYGTWVDLCNDPKWQHFHFTMNDNPSIPFGAMQATLDNEFNGDENNVTWQREYLANHVIDTTRMIIPSWHEIEKIPDNFIATGCYVGVDYGDSDYNALVPVVFNNEGKLYAIKSLKFNKCDVTTIVEEAAKIDDYINKTFKVRAQFVADTSHQAISREIARRGIHISNAYKIDLKQQLFNLKDYVVNGTIEFVGCPELIDEFKNSVWKWDDERKSVIYEEDKEYYHPDCLHALRYAVTVYRGKYRR